MDASLRIQPLPGSMRAPLAHTCLREVNDATATFEDFDKRITGLWVNTRVAVRLGWEHTWSLDR